MTHTIQFTNLDDLINDLATDGDETTILRITPLQNRRTQHGVIHTFTFQITVRAINHDNHILMWTYITSQFTATPHDGREQYDEEWSKLKETVQTIRQYLQTNHIHPSRIRPGLIELPPDHPQPLDGHWPIQEDEAQS